jgi:drug/metabolite transporter (DMT)-like permease
MNEDYVPIFALVVLRVAGATLLFWMFSPFLPQEKIDKRDYIKFFIAAIFGVVINMLLFLKGLELTTPISASVIVTITPIIILVLSYFFLQEKITKLKIVGVILGFCGGILLTTLGTSTRIGDNLPLGNLFIFINVISYSIYIILIKKLTNKYHPFTFIKWLFLFGFFMVLPFGYSEVMEIQWHTFTPYVWFSVLFVVVGATFGTYLLNPIALRQLKASTIGIFIYLQPVIAGLFAIIMGSDSIGYIKVIAMLLIFCGVYLVTKKPKISA